MERNIIFGSLIVIGALTIGLVRTSESNTNLKHHITRLEGRLETARSQKILESKENYNLNREIRELKGELVYLRSKTKK